ncbi:MAG: cbb3-type cytochrome c oxidase subunit II [Planctomycetes bacterium]|nr:cbb3-type cytochrome c oxidase subunit II [Planctomycetota bacterium]
MRAAVKMGVVLLLVAVIGGVVPVQGKDTEKGQEKEKSEKPGKKKRTKLTKAEKKALAAKRRLALYGRKLFQQSGNFAKNGKSCNSCHQQGSDKNLAGKVTEDNSAEAREAITKCLENRMQMKDDEGKKKLWEKNPQNMDAIIAYLQMLKPRHRR